MNSKRKVGLDPTKDFEEPVKRPRQERLSGTEDAKIDRLEELAQDYAAIRDQRQRLTVQEVELKKKLMDAMEANKKEVYKRDGIEIKIVAEEKTVKVKVSKADED